MGFQSSRNVSGPIGLAMKILSIGNENLGRWERFGCRDFVAPDLTNSELLSDEVESP
jgi:hypothetical protein